MGASELRQSTNRGLTTGERAFDPSIRVFGVLHIRAYDKLLLFDLTIYTKVSKKILLVALCWCSLFSSLHSRLPLYRGLLS